MKLSQLKFIILPHSLTLLCLSKRLKTQQRISIFLTNRAKIINGVIG